MFGKYLKDLDETVFANALKEEGVKVSTDNKMVILSTGEVTLDEYKALLIEENQRKNVAATLKTRFETSEMHGRI